MVFGLFDGSTVIVAFKYTVVPMVVVAWFPLQTRFICFRISSGIVWPFAEPETMDHSPCNWAISFLVISESWAHVCEVAHATNPIRSAFFNVFICVFDLKPQPLKVDHRRQRPIHEVTQAA